AARQELPILCVHAGHRAGWEDAAGAVARLELTRGRSSFPLDHDLRHDPLLWRHAARVIQEVRAFGPDVVHITGPSDVGQLGALVAHRLRVPLVGSWHTNLHDFAAWRVESRLAFLPGAWRQYLSGHVRRHALWATLRFYRLPSVLLAPNMELV